MRKKAVIDDGFNAELLEDAVYDGKMEIPIIGQPKTLIVPKAIVPYSERHKISNKDVFIGFYEHDVKFAELLANPIVAIEDLQQYKGVISPDCSLYFDMPLCTQLMNIFRNRAIGSYFQSKGLYVIPNIRWGDQRTYTTEIFPEKVAFLGVEKYSIVAIGTYGCIKGNTQHFKAGLKCMLEELEPTIVLVYGTMPDKIFGEFKKYTTFIQYDDWITRRHRQNIEN